MNTLAYLLLLPASLVYTLRESILGISCGPILSTLHHLQCTIMMVHYETGKLQIGRVVDASSRSTNIPLDDRGGISVFGMRRWPASRGKQLR